MVNIVWLVMIVFGILGAGANGNIDVVTKAALDGANDAVKISLSLIAIISFWLGIMKLAEEAGLVRALALLVRPVMRFLFPSVPKDHPAMGAIVMNLSANILGLGNALHPWVSSPCGSFRISTRAGTPLRTPCVLFWLSTLPV